MLGVLGNQEKKTCNFRYLNTDGLGLKVSFSEEEKYLHCSLKSRCISLAKVIYIEHKWSQDSLAADSNKTE